ncbi:MAG: PDZ domain-containing protein [Saprospiraceae bacterium]|nr:PDZ domain-containing protein [Saprospiraceae bacterium]
MQPSLLQDSPLLRSFKITWTALVYIFSQQNLIEMKRLLHSAICTLLLLALISQAAFSQDAIAPNTSNKVTIIQKTQNEDGSWSVKKKTVEKGQSAEDYMKELEISTPIESVKEVIIVNGDEAKTENPNAETIIMIRQGNNKTEIKWDDTEGGEFPNFNWNDEKQMHRSFNRDMAAFTLIGDETAEPKAFLGIYPERHENGGILVTDIVPGAGAAAAGLRSGDIIISIDGKTLASRGGLSSTLGAYKPGDKIEVSLLREGQSITAIVELTARKHESNRNYTFNFNNKAERNPCEVFIGVTIGSWGREGEAGVGIDGIIPGWPAEEAGLKEGDRILSMDGVDVNTHNELVIERDKHQPGEYFKVEFLRDGKVMKTKARFKSCDKEEVKEDVLEQTKTTELPKIENSLVLEEINAFPNPTVGNLSVTFKGEAIPTIVTITDINGKVVFNENLKNFDGLYNRQVDVSQGAPGTLMVSIRQNGKVLTKPVVLLNRA